MKALPYTQNYFPSAQFTRRAKILIIFLILVDLAFIALDFTVFLLESNDFLVRPRLFVHFSVSHEQGIAEVFNYAKFVFLFGILCVISLASRSSVYFILAVVFLYGLIDDALALHERADWAFKEVLFLPEFFREEGYSQLLYFAGIAGLFSLALLVAWLRADPAHRRYAAAMILSICALAFFAVIVDFIHGLVYHLSPALDRALDIFEDGGEMLVVTLSCWVALAIYSSVKNQPA